MPVDYSFFEASLADQRTYRGQWDRQQLGLFEGAQARGRLELLSRKRDDLRFRGTHVMRPGHPLGLAQVNEQLGITLPEDIDAFYRRWNGGLLVLKRFYHLLSAADIIRRSREMRQIRREPGPPELPWHLVRFCDLGNSEYLALRFDPSTSDWNVFWASHEELDAYYIADTAKPPGRREFTIVDPSFRSWLQRMCATDGWPECPDDNPTPPFFERVAV